MCIQADEVDKVIGARGYKYFGDRSKRKADRPSHKQKLVVR